MPLEQVFSDEGIVADFTFEAPKTLLTYDYPAPKSDARNRLGASAYNLCRHLFLANQKNAN
jgi:hypothetical protein